MKNHQMETGGAKKGSSKDKSCGKEPEECYSKIKYYFLLAKKKQIIFYAYAFVSKISRVLKN